MGRFEIATEDEIATWSESLQEHGVFIEVTLVVDLLECTFWPHQLHPLLPRDHTPLVFEFETTYSPATGLILPVATFVAKLRSVQYSTNKYVEGEMYAGKGRIGTDAFNFDVFAKYTHMATCKPGKMMCISLSDDMMQRVWNFTKYPLPLYDSVSGAKVCFLPRRPVHHPYADDCCDFPYTLDNTRTEMSVVKADMFPLVYLLFARLYRFGKTDHAGKRVRRDASALVDTLDGWGMLIWNLPVEVVVTDILPRMTSLTILQLTTKAHDACVDRKWAQVLKNRHVGASPAKQLESL